MLNMKNIVLFCVILVSGCRTRTSGGSFMPEHGLAYPERIVIAVADGLEKEGFIVTTTTNTGYHISFQGSTVIGSVQTDCFGVDWKIGQDRWRPWGAAAYDRARRVIDQNVN